MATNVPGVAPAASSSPYRCCALLMPASPSESDRPGGLLRLRQSQRRICKLGVGRLETGTG